jgi:CheY-like chemotaxis protein
MKKAKSSGTKILVIDDDDDIRETMRAVLEDEGFTVESASNGREALDLLLRSEANPALILLDLTMPQMDGWQFRSEQKKVPRLAGIPVVVFTGNAEADRATDSLDAAALMRKPLRLDGVVTLVDQLARHRKAN